MLTKKIILHNFCDQRKKGLYPKTIKELNKLMFSSELIVFFTAMIPFTDLKVAIPIGQELGLSLTNTLIFACAGMLIPGAIALALIGPMTNYAQKKSKTLHKWIKKLLKKTRKEHSKKFQRYGAILLILVVGVPLPGSGTVTGALIAFLFGVDYWKALTLIIIGTIIAGLLVTTGVESIQALIRLFT